MPADAQNQQRGRGTPSNPRNRYVEIDLARDEDWNEPDARVRTVYLRDDSKSILSENNNPDLNFRYAINPYRGCEHGCVYCYARSYHEYLGFSAGLDFETKILVKENAPQLLEKEFRKKRWQAEQVSFSGVTDAWQPIEKKLEISRRCLEVCAKFRNPVSIITKNALVTRDLDHLVELNRYGAVAVVLSITTLDHKLTQALEPRTTTPQGRLKAMGLLADAGIPVGVMIGPVIPGLNMEEIPAILKASAAAGARFAAYNPIRLGHNLPKLFEAWLDEHMPDRKGKVLKGVRSLNGGEFYSPMGDEQASQSEARERLRFIFQAGLEQAGIPQDYPELSREHFRVPNPQRQLFG